MATQTITCSKSTYIHSTDTSAHGNVSRPYTAFWYKDPAQAEVMSSVFQFQIPSSMKYKRINSVKLNFYQYKVENLPNLAGDGLGIRPFNAGDVINSLTYGNASSQGILGEWIEFEKLWQYQDASYLPRWKSVDITNIYINNVYNNQYFTIFVCSGPSLSYYNLTPSRLGGAGDTYPPYIVIDYTDVEQLPPTPAYPSNVYINENTDILFSWTFNSSTQAKQSAAVLEYKLASAAAYTVVNLTQEGYSYKLTGGLPQGAYEWRVKVTNDAGEISGYSTVAQFNVIGKPAAPVIGTPVNSSRTTIRWNSTDQNAFEIILTAADGTVLANEIVSSAETEYKPNMFLANGSYTVGIRTKNSSGIFSEFAYKAFTINVSGPAKPAAVIRQDGAKVYLKFDNPLDIGIAVMRQEKGKTAECIALFEGIETEYVDSTLRSGIEYSYFVRAFNSGYTDSDREYVFVTLNGMQLTSDELEVNLTISEERFQAYTETLTRETAMLNFSGREYPLVERGEFTEQKISRMYFANDKEREILSEMLKRPKAFYRDSKGNAFPCALVGVSFKQYKDSGYNASIELIRISAEEVDINV